MKTPKSIMKSITRPHNFTNRINHVQRGRKYYYISSENAVNSLRVPRTPGLDKAFEDENWQLFEAAFILYI